jgi:hypothetical protein
MPLLSKILSAPVSGPAWALGFVFGRVKDQVESEFLNEGKVQAELLDLTMRYERGEVDDEGYRSQEAAILEHLNTIRAYKESAASDQVEASESSEG